MARTFPKGHYVYVHIRKTDNKIFYVGKGQQYRAWNRTGRNDHWNKTYKKHGRKVHIIKQGLTEPEALSLECILIAIYKSLNLPLTNKTDGGEGVNGYKPCIKARIKLSRSHGGKVVHSSCGKTFETPALAAEWLRKNGYPKANQAHISSCARGKRGSAYNRTWWNQGNAPKVYSPRYERMSITQSIAVYCSNGMKFRNIRHAGFWLEREFQIPSGAAGVSQCISGLMSTAYGFAWWREGESPKTYEMQKLIMRRGIGRKVILNERMCFYTLTEAASYMVDELKLNYNTAKICSSCKSGKADSYGNKWKYIDEGN